MAGGRVVLWLGDVDNQHRHDSQECCYQIDQQHALNGQQLQQQRAQRGRDDIQPTIEHLIDALNARQMLRRHDERGRGGHRRIVECAAQGTDKEDDIDVPDFDYSQPEQDRQGQRGQGHHRVGQDHRSLAVPAVDQWANERAEGYLGYQTDHRGQGQYRGRSRLLRQPPDESELHQLAAQ